MRDNQYLDGVFRYLGYEIDPLRRRLSCRCALDELQFCENITFPTGDAWHEPAVAEAARLVFLLSAVSYYKTRAPLTIDLGVTAVTDAERLLLRQFYLDGLGEFSYRNALDLADLQIIGPRLDRAHPVPLRSVAGLPLLPFGGGVDSIVATELIKSTTTTRPALFIVNRPDDRFEAIERPALTTGLPVLRAERLIDEQVLHSRRLGFLNGHVPVTGIISTIAIMAAVLNGRDAVVMSNEWSASIGTVRTKDRFINHQYSKSRAFEYGLRSVLAETFGDKLDYFSVLRPYTGLWIARQFATLPKYFADFRSCNRAFHIDPNQRLTAWCGHCDKCCFIDLILAPYIDEPTLRGIFGGHEPLADPARFRQFRTLLGLSPDAKPWECVGDKKECRAAARLASMRADRAGSSMIGSLLAELAGTSADEPDAGELMHPVGDHFIPEKYAPPHLVV
ncbi:MAG: hypothetical protein ACRDRI_10550 [Pseudonocardiaceae bacterium]